jgi:hypothetical protein
VVGWLCANTLLESCGRGRRAVARLPRRGLRHAGGRRPCTGLGGCGAEAVILGQGEYRYRVVEGWGDLPPGYTSRDGAAVCVDSKDNVYVFNRDAHPVIVFDRDGKFLGSWGEDIGFVNAHGAAVGPDDMVYLTDDFGAAVRKCSLQGKVVLTISTPGKPAPRISGDPFNRCTHTALSPRGDIYVSDGNQNARVHKYSPDGKLLFSWGERERPPASSTSSTTSPATTMAGSMSRTGRTIVCRCSTATANTRCSGTI